MSGTGSEGLCRRFHFDDRPERRIGSPRDHRAAPDRDPFQPLPAAPRNRCDARHARRREPAAFSVLGVLATTDARLGGRGAFWLPEPANVVARCVVLHLRDDYDRRLRRFQLRPTIHFPAAVRYWVDVQRCDRYRRPGRVPGGPTAVAPLRPNGRTATGTPYARPRRCHRAGI